MTPNSINEAGHDCEVTAGSDKGTILANTVKLLSAAAIACTLSVSPREAHADETFINQTVGYVPPTYANIGDITHFTEVEYNDIVNSFIASIDAMPERGETEVSNGITAIQILQGIKYSGNLETLFDRLIQEYGSNGGDARAALEKLYSGMNDVERMAVEHSEAISLGRDRFIDNTLLYNPSYTEGRLRRAPIDVKMERAGQSFDHRLQAILRNNPEALTSEGLTEFVQYTRDFTEVYLMSEVFAGEFPQEYLERAIRIIESAERTAESAERTAESAERTAESAERTAESAERTAELIQQSERLTQQMRDEFARMSEIIRMKRANS